MIIENEEMLALLQHNGSTTYMLESLLYCHLEIKVLYQKQIMQKALESNIIEILKPTSNAIYIERYSNLITEELFKVSHNYVVFKIGEEDKELLEVLINKNLPIGKNLECKSIQHTREAIGYGQIITNNFGSYCECFYKHYLIKYSNDSCMYIKETFNPQLIEQKRFI
jgi:chorismate-pyruvate lyase